MKKAVIIGITVVCVVILVICFYLLACANTQESLQNLVTTFGYPGVFLLGFIGAASVIIPIPYTVVLLVISAPQFGFDPLLLAVFVSFGAAAGELVGYGLGYVGRRVVSKKYDRRLNAMLRIFNRFGVAAVFIFALTPLPDDLLLIPLGLLHYNFWKVFIPCVAGKFLMSLIITYAGAAAGQMFVEAGVLIAVITAILLILAVIAMFCINWEKLAEKYAPRKARKHGRS